MNTRRLMVAYLVVLLAGMTAANQWVAYRLHYHPALGGLHVGGHVVYPPWAMFVWAHQFGPSIPNTLSEGYAIIGGAFILATIALVGARQLRRHIPVREIGKERWASKRDMKRAGLLNGNGTVLGHAYGRYSGLILR